MIHTINSFNSMPVKCTGIEVILELVVTKSLQVYWKKWRGALKLIIKLFLKESKSPLELAFKSSFGSTFECSLIAARHRLSITNNRADYSNRPFSTASIGRRIPLGDC